MTKGEMQMENCKNCVNCTEPCEERDECIDQPRRQKAWKPTVYPREWEPESYSKTKYQYVDMP